MINDKPMVNLYGRVEKDRVGTTLTFDEATGDVDVDSMMLLIQGWIDTLVEIHNKLAAGDLGKDHPLH